MQTLKDMLAAIGGGEMTPGGGIGGGQSGFPQRPQMAEPRKLKDWQKIMGVIGSGLTAMGGGRPTFARNLMEERQQQEAARQRFDLAEYEGQLNRANKQWEWQNKPDEPTTQMRNFQEWTGLPDDMKELFAEYYDTIQPDFVSGADGRQYQRTRTGLPPGYDPNEWEPVEGPEGGAGGNVSGGFPR